VRVPHARADREIVQLVPVLNRGRGRSGGVRGTAVHGGGIALFNGEPWPAMNTRGILGSTAQSVLQISGVNLVKVPATRARIQR
jgi:hypothetical protein